MMGLFKTIDGLLAGTKYLAWGIALLGIAGSVVLFFANIGLGFGTAAIFIATLLLSIGVTLLLMPKQLAKGKFESKSRYIAGAVSIVISVVVMGIVYMSAGGFPAVNLIFA